MNCYYGNFLHQVDHRELEAIVLTLRIFEIFFELLIIYTIFMQTKICIVLSSEKKVKSIWNVLSSKREIKHLTNQIHNVIALKITFTQNINVKIH